MIEPIPPSSLRPAWPINLDPISHKTIPSKDDLHAAEQEVAASMWYQSTIKSHAASLDNPEKKQAIQATEKKAVEKSFLGRAKDWLWGIFGWGQKQPVAEAEVIGESISKSENEETENLEIRNIDSSFAEGIPKLQAPEITDKKRISQAISDLNRELVNRLKDMAEFQVEMEKKTGSGKFDKFIYLQLFNSSMEQKRLRESSSLISHEHILQLHKKDKELKKAHFDLIDALIHENETRGKIKWIKAGLTVVAMGGTALAVFLGGPVGVLGVAVPLASGAKGVTTWLDGDFKVKADRKTGKILGIKHETKTNSSIKNEQLFEMQNAGEEIGRLLELVRNLLKNQSRAERASFKSNT